MKIAIIGAGLLGCTLGGQLALAGQEIVMVTGGASLRAVRDHGLRIDGVDDDFVARVNATDEPEDVGPVDAVLVGFPPGEALLLLEPVTPQQQTAQLAAVLQSIRPLLGDDSMVVAFVAEAALLRPFVRTFGGRVVGAVASLRGALVTPGHVRLERSLRVTLAELAEPEPAAEPGEPARRGTSGELGRSTSARVVRLARTFEEAGVRAAVSLDFHAALARAAEARDAREPPSASSASGDAQDGKAGADRSGAC